MATASHSVSEWIASLKNGDLQSVQKLWDRYKHQLIAAARDRLSRYRSAADDEDDISQSVLIAIWRGAMSGRFDDIHNRDDLWWTLLRLTKFRVIDSIRFRGAKKRGGISSPASVRLESDLRLCETFTLETLIGDKMTHETVTALEEQTAAILDKLRNPALKLIARDRIEGYTPHEIAERMEIPLRSVERKLKLIRDRWSRELERENTSGFN